MLTINGKAQRFCDGVSRRNFIKIGALGMGGLALPQLLRAEAAAQLGKSTKSIIMVYLPGGPSHQDMYDLKMDAPSEIRGSFMPIKTNVPGIQICEHMPRLAAMMDKFVAIRSLVGQVDDHNSFHCMTGRSRFGQQPPGGWPSLGSVVSKVQGSAALGVPPLVGLSGKEAVYGYLGAANGPFIPSGPGTADMTLNGVTTDRLEDRKGLLSEFDRFRRDADSSGLMDGLDVFNRQAFEVITSSRFVSALDMKSESPKATERYKVPGKDGGMMKDFLMARRLVEAGVRCVTLNYGGWDTHGQNFTTLKRQLPQLDIGVTALMQDLIDRGMDKDVSLVVWGEFGRTPRINKDAGRDHWSRVMGALLAGGGMKTGQVIGSTDRTGGEANDRPVHIGEVFATLYKNLGIDTHSVQLNDLAGRPQYLVDPQHSPMRELV
jgi:hypothetical protein